MAKLVTKRWLLLSIILICLALVFYFRLYAYLSFTTIQQHHQLLQDFANRHYFFTCILYMLIYIVTVALSIPGALFLTLAGGLLFGPLAVVYVVISATIGSAIIFLAVRTALAEWMTQKARGWLAKMESGFRENAFNYILILRLIPIFPFWAVNIVSGLLAVRLSTFLLATLLGIIPGSLVYVLVGNGLNKLLATKQAPDLRIIFTPAIFLPLLGLAVLALLPVVYKKIKIK